MIWYMIDKSSPKKFQWEKRGCVDLLCIESLRKKFPLTHSYRFSPPSFLHHSSLRNLSLSPPSLVIHLLKLKSYLLHKAFLDLFMRMVLFISSMKNKTSSIGRKKVFEQFSEYFIRQNWFPCLKTKTKKILTPKLYDKHS